MTEDSSSRTRAAALRRDLKLKLVVLTGARQAGKIHKMRDWKAFLKGARDGRAKGQAMLVTGSARMDPFRQGGESLAGRHHAWRLHPFSVRELMVTQGVSAGQALARLLERGGFPEPCLTELATDADRWRAQYATDLVREDVLDFSRVHEVRALQLLFTMLRERVGSPLNVSSLAQALQISPITATRYIEILEALYIVFRVTPWHRHVARSLLKEAKIYFLDTGLVKGDEGLKLENAVAAMLPKHCHYRQDAEGKPIARYTIRDKERNEIDFVAELRQPAQHVNRPKSLLDTGRCLTRQFPVEEIGSSPATVKRYIAYLRDCMNAPIVVERLDKLQWATLRFTPERERWVAAETRHPKQRGHSRAAGHDRLELPYADPRKLVMASPAVRSPEPAR